MNYTLKTYAALHGAEREIARLKSLLEDKSRTRVGRRKIASSAELFGTNDYHLLPGSKTSPTVTVTPKTERSHRLVPVDSEWRRSGRGVFEEALSDKESLNSRPEQSPIRVSLISEWRAGNTGAFEEAINELQSSTDGRIILFDVFQLLQSIEELHPISDDTVCHVLRHVFSPKVEGSSWVMYFSIFRDSASILILKPVLNPNDIEDLDKLGVARAVIWGSHFDDFERVDSTVHTLSDLLVMLKRYNSGTQAKT